ncbi:MAG: hypothetical protein Harvfovirus5_50 [Harvfovirus sp.]|uniref:Uncharacterized protein n=1 Tax=Harvfovirus sp. TaxID=2487768 RepID=A0A3G5A0J5_9VIRU|nr:MAG: hypothetical protein Harvfovirus5_50 [Harvfovirus sp.]
MFHLLYPLILTLIKQKMAEVKRDAELKDVVVDRLLVPKSDIKRDSELKDIVVDQFPEAVRREVEVRLRVRKSVSAPVTRKMENQKFVCVTGCEGFDVENLKIKLGFTGVVINVILQQKNHVAFVQFSNPVDLDKIKRRSHLFDNCELRYCSEEEIKMMGSDPDEGLRSSKLILFVSNLIIPIETLEKKLSPIRIKTVAYYLCQKTGSVVTFIECAGPVQQDDITHGYLFFSEYPSKLCSNESFEKIKKSEKYKCIT